MILSLLGSLALMSTPVVASANNLNEMITSSNIIDFNDENFNKMDDKYNDINLINTEYNYEKGLIREFYKIETQVALDVTTFTFNSGVVSNRAYFPTALTYALNWADRAEQLGADDWSVSKAPSILNWEGTITHPTGWGTIIGYALGINDGISKYLSDLDNFSHGKGSTGYFYFQVTGSGIFGYSTSLYYKPLSGSAKLVVRSNTARIPTNARADVFYSFVIAVDYKI
ncbi:hypothetical protein [Spiroplasma culicicola]|uniref:Uncharacterized protein n=1 Tax=Spiroplasma culicicola AES-1 TaxID=1276246 RepID=W6A718_9MOLU|nr:hypothetical protein [Spiroplasma culicicola]AHI52933.1 hypothetical protein SCULI_v1c05920 [Spiroplasma culicicola AES-1]